MSFTPEQLQLITWLIPVPPLLSFALTIAAFFELQSGGVPLVEPVYQWALIGESSFDIAFYFDKLSAVMTLVVTGVPWRTVRNCQLSIRANLPICARSLQTSVR